MPDIVVSGGGRMTRLVEGAVLVTGGGSGIGRGIALALAAEGAAVAILDLLPGGGRETVTLIEAAGGSATFVQVDVGQYDDVDRAYGDAVAAVGALGIVVNAAGISDGYAQAGATEPSVWERVIGINLTGTF